MVISRAILKFLDCQFFVMIYIDSCSYNVSFCDRMIVYCAILKVLGCQVQKDEFEYAHKKTNLNPLYFSHVRIYGS